MQQHGGADADSKPVDGGDQRLAVARQRLEEVDGDRLEPAFGGLEEIRNIAAGGKRPRRTGKDDAADRGGFAGLIERAGHRRIHRLGQRVLLLRPVHPDGADRTVVGDEN
jgi:hypothetical protein